jgi:MFS family permease
MSNNGKAEKFDFLWIILFLIIFINGFEAGGYQASLRSIGQNYDLSETSKGLFAATELFATMLAPLLLGAWADANVKTKCIRILLIIQLLASIGILLFNIQSAFVIGVFFLGLTTSALQFITIAALADTYPISCSK